MPRLTLPTIVPRSKGHQTDRARIPALTRAMTSTLKALGDCLCYHLQGAGHFVTAT